MNKLWAIAVTSFLGSAPSLALAQTTQPWLEDRSKPGIGIRAGDLELHPGLAGEVGYDSNYFLSSGDTRDTVGEPVVPSARLRITPSLSLSTLGQQRSQGGSGSEGAALPKIAFEAQLAARLNQLFALSSDFAPNDSSRTYLDGDIGAQLDVLPKRPWSFSLNAAAARVAQPSDNPDVLIEALSRTSLAGGADVHWRPGGGTLEWSLGYDARLTVFDQVDYGLDSVDQGVDIKGRWTFLPRTALLYDGRVGFVNYLQSNGRLQDSTPISSTIGINGLVTSRLAVLLQGGWRATFFQANTSGQYDDYDGPIGRAEVTWFIGSAGRTEAERSVGLSNLRVGYLRDVATSGLANYYVVDRAYADLSYSAGGVLLLGFRAGMSFLTHPQPFDSDGTALADGEVHEQRPDARVTAEYRLTSSFALIGSLDYSASLGDHIITIQPARNLQDNLKFTRFAALVGARWFM